MRLYSSIDRFIAQLDRLTASLKGDGDTGLAVSVQALDQAEREFATLITPIIGVSPAKNFAARIRRRLEKNTANSPLRKMGYIAAFFRGEYDDTSRPLEAEDWQEIRETIEDASEEIDIAALTSLMDGLLSRRLLERR
jgi:hypothetical protein